MDPITAITLLKGGYDLFFGKKDKDTGEQLTRGLAKSKTVQGGAGLLALVATMVLPRALDGEWPALLITLGGSALFGLVMWGRATASKPLVRE